MLFGQNWIFPNLDRSYRGCIATISWLIASHESFCASRVSFAITLWLRRDCLTHEKRVFSVTPMYLAEISHINRPILFILPVYDELNPDKEFLKQALGANLEFSSNKKSISVASLSPKLRLLTMIMYSNLYPLSSTSYMNLGRALFLRDLIFDEEIDVCSHIFHILAKMVDQTASRNCIPFCRLISRILKLKGMHPSEDERPYPRPSPINNCTLHASMGHTKKNVQQESHANPGSSNFTPHAYDEWLDNIMAALHEINTKISGLATIMHS